MSWACRRGEIKTAYLDTGLPLFTHYFTPLKSEYFRENFVFWHLKIKLGSHDIIMKVGLIR
jgi:hypothetical protein